MGEMALNLLRNSDWNVRTALEFYFKHEGQINPSSLNNSTTANKKSNSKNAKKRKLKQMDDINDDQPLKRIKLMKPWNKLTVSDLKKEIKKRNQAQKISNCNKAELKSMLFSQMSLSDAQINKLKKNEIVNELKRCDKYKGMSSWNRSDLADYLKHIYSNLNAFDGVNNQYGADRNHKISKEELHRMPLFKIHQIFGIESKQTNRNKIYKLLQKRWEAQRKYKEEPKAKKMTARDIENVMIQRRVAEEDMMQKNKFLKERERNKSAMEWNICGEWKIDKDTNYGYRNNGRYYLDFNERDDCIFGSFLIGPLEGKMRLKETNIYKQNVVKRKSIVYNIGGIDDDSNYDP